ncbi:sperm-specific protein Don juan [Drosophila sechellia]|uniref:GM10924 n=1 Tax=Drosophila sechellia TaxID=7238 RepID=B4I4M5_DROSE|nr:sperm-specific protein Don juan [Drosophila sechellia]EDW55168.1 GM10924 [Drosophila sechellia]
MLKRPALVYRCLQTSVKRPYHLNALEHLRKIEILKPESQPSQKPKKIGDGSIGVIHVIKNKYYGRPNPMQRKFLEDLEQQQDRRKKSNLSLKEEKREDLEKIMKECQKLFKEITMQANDGDVKKICKELAQKEKLDKEKIKKKCRELAAREKCEKDKMKKKCKKLLKKDKCKKKKTCKEEKPCQEEDPCEKKSCCPKDPCAKKPKKVDPCKKKDPCKKEDPCKKKAVNWKKKCKEVAEREQCKKLAEKKKFKKMIRICKNLAAKAKCKKMAEKEMCRKKAKKGKKK